MPDDLSAARARLAARFGDDMILRLDDEELNVLLVGCVLRLAQLGATAEEIHGVIQESLAINAGLVRSRH
jgi:hypothetical protein